MSFNRVRYDNCAYALQMERSTHPGDYRLFAPYAENCNPCMSFDGPVGSKSDVSLTKENMELNFQKMAEAESKLSWRNQLLTKCNDNSNPIGSMKTNHKPICSNKLTAEDTRFTYPIDNFRSMSLTPYMVVPYLHVNPQCHIQESTDRLGLDTRITSKDTYKIPAQQAWDTNKALPTERPSKK
jgi:hypothetical protein